MAPIDVTGFQRLLDQEPAEARTVEEEIGFDALSAGERQRFDETVLSAQDDIDDLALAEHHTARLRIKAKIFRILSGIELEGVIDLAEGRIGGAVAAHELFLLGRKIVQRVIVERVWLAKLVQLEPVGMKQDAAHVPAERPKRMEIGMPDLLPVDEFDAELERRARLPHEFVLVQRKHAVEGGDLWDRRLAAADGADLLRLDQSDRSIVGGQDLGECGCGHAAGRAAAQDDDAANPVIGHGWPPKPGCVRRAWHCNAALYMRRATASPRRSFG